MIFLHMSAKNHPIACKNRFVFVYLSSACFPIPLLKNSPYTSGIVRGSFIPKPQNVLQ
jgi:hypothetical protein